MVDCPQANLRAQDYSEFSTTLNPSGIHVILVGMAGQPREFPAAALEALTRGHKIEAIKIVRQDWGLGLKESKDAVESYVKERPDLASKLQSASAVSKGTWLWLLIILSAILLFYLYRQG